MRDEETLRRILHEEARAVDPEGSFDDVVRRARRPRRLPLAAAAAAAVLLVGAVALVMAQGERIQVVTVPDAGDDPPTTSSTLVEPVAEDVGAGVWPFTTGAEADEFAEANPGSRYADPGETARAFLETYLGMPEQDVSPFAAGDSRSGEVVARLRDGGPETTVLLRQLGASEVWTVVGAFTDSIRLNSPGALDPVASPAAVRGTSCCTFEGNVVVQVREDGQDGPEEFLGQMPAIGGAMGDHELLQADVAFSPPSRSGGAVVAFTTSPEDGSVDRATVVRVRFASEAGGDGPPTPSQAALDDELVVVVVRQPGSEFDMHAVVVMDARDGTVTRELAVSDSVEGGVLDVALTPDRRTVLYVVSTSACTSQLRAVSLADGTETVLAEEELTTPSRLAVHPRDGRIAVATDDDCDGQSELVVTSPAGAELGRWPDAEADTTGPEALYAAVRSLAWVDDRTIALGMHYEDGVTTTLHDVTSPDQEVGAAPEVAPAEDVAAYDLPATTGVDGTFGVVRRCCDLEASAAALVRIDRTGAEVERPVADASGRVTALEWLGSTPLWVTDAGLLRRLVDGVVVELARHVVDVAV